MVGLRNDVSYGVGVCCAIEERRRAIDGAAAIDRRVAVHTVGAIDLERRGFDWESFGAVRSCSRANRSDMERSRELHQPIGE